MYGASEWYDVNPDGTIRWVSHFEAWQRERKRQLELAEARARRPLIIRSFGPGVAPPRAGLHRDDDPSTTKELLDRILGTDESPIWAR